MTNTKVLNADAGAAVSELFSVLQENSTPNHSFFMLVAATELLRRTKNKDQIKALADFFTAVSSADPEHHVDSINFSLTQNRLGSAYDEKIMAAGADTQSIPAVLTAALAHFIGRVVHDYDTLSTRAATLEDMVASVAVMISLLRGDAKTDEIKEISHSRFFDVYNNPDYFTGPEITLTDLKTISAEFISYCGELSSGELGPEIRGLSIEGPDGKLHTFLETGEYVQLKPGTIGVAAYTEPEQIKNLPSVLLLYAVLSADILLSQNAITQEQHALLMSGSFGLPVDSDPLVAVVDAKEIAPAEALLHTRDNGSLGSEAVAPFNMEFPVDEDYAVRLSAVYSKTGSYITVQLFDVSQAPEELVMTHSVPKFFSGRGVYIFPLRPQQLLSLVILN